MKGYKYVYIITSIIIGLILLSVLYKNLQKKANKQTEYNYAALEEYDDSEKQLTNYRFDVEKAKVSQKEWNGWTKKTVIRYSDNNEKVLGYVIKDNSGVTNYYINADIIMIETFSAESSETELWRQEKDIVHNVADIGKENFKIWTVQEVSFLYNKLLDKQEMENCSKYAKLGEKLEWDNFEQYEKYLTFQNEEFIQCIYSYTSDAANISLQQALVLCAEILLETSPEMKLEKVMAEEPSGYVGYKFNYRETQEQIFENKVGTLGTNFFDGMQLEIFLYEDIIDDKETGENHTAVTGTFHFFLKDKIVVLE